MATLKKKVDEVQTNVEQTEAKFSKEQLIASDKYANRRDLVSALLDDNETYTIATVDKKIEEFMKGKVKS